MESVDKGCRVKETQICEMDKNITLFPPPQSEVKVKVKDDRYMKAWGGGVVRGGLPPPSTQIKLK